MHRSLPPQITQIVLDLLFDCSIVSFGPFWRRQRHSIDVSHCVLTNHTTNSFEGNVFHILKQTNHFTWRYEVCPDFVLWNIFLAQKLTTSENVIFLDPLFGWPTFNLVLLLRRQLHSAVVNHYILSIFDPMFTWRLVRKLSR